MMQTVYAAAVADFGRAAETLAARPECSGPATAMGFCFGGRLAFNLLSNDKVSSAVCYYGGGIDLHLVEPTSKPVLFHYAGADPHISRESVLRHLTAIYPARKLDAVSLVTNQPFYWFSLDNVLHSGSCCRSGGEMGVLSSRNSGALLNAARLRGDVTSF